MSETESPRGPGAPKGRPKPAKSGRKPGTKNKRTVLGKDFVRPLWPLARRRLRALLEGASDDLAFKAAVKILEFSYGRPPETKLIGGDGGEPIRRETLQGSRLGHDRELARRLQLALQVGAEAEEDPPHAPAPDSRPYLRPRSNGAARASEAPAGGNGERLEVGAEVSLPDRATATVIATQSAGVGTWKVCKADGSEVKILPSLTKGELAKWAVLAAEKGRLS